LDELLPEAELSLDVLVWEELVESDVLLSDLALSLFVSDVDEAAPSLLPAPVPFLRA
jgi:hypothetical protein